MLVPDLSLGQESTKNTETLISYHRISLKEKYIDNESLGLDIIKNDEVVDTIEIGLIEEDGLDLIWAKILDSIDIDPIKSLEIIEISLKPDQLTHGSEAVLYNCTLSAENKISSYNGYGTSLNRIGAFLKACVCLINQQLAINNNVRKEFIAKYLT